MTERVRPEDIESLVEIFQASDWKEMRLRFKDADIFLSKDATAGVVRNIERRNTPRPGAVAQRPVAEAASTVPPQSETGAAERTAPADIPEHWVPIKAPNLGTFYRAPKPGAPPFVETGQSIDPDTEVCLIEVMKLFTALKAGVAGVVRKICAEDGELIESGEVLLYIEPWAANASGGGSGQEKAA